METADEFLALESIFGEEFKRKSSTEGEITLEITADAPVNITIPGLSSVLSVSCFPPLHLTFELPPGYPLDKQPLIFLRSSWIPLDKLNDLCRKALELYCGDFCVFSIADFLKTCTLQSLGITSQLVLDPADFPDSKLEDVFGEISRYQKKYDTQSFNSQSHFCSICLETLKGSLCHSFNKCKHVYCKACLEGFFSACINDGKFILKCPHESCLKSDDCLDPIDLEPILLLDTFQIFKERFEKLKMELDPNVFECPACSKSFKFEVDVETTLILCPYCTYPSCKLCKKLWHGSTKCVAPGTEIILNGKSLFLSPTQTKQLIIEYNSPETTLEEKTNIEQKMGGKKNLQKLLDLVHDEIASKKWISNNSKPCPTCGSAVEKSGGCNHVTCAICGHHFCWLCGFWISSANPYTHFNSANSDCNQKLFDNTDTQDGANDELNEEEEGFPDFYIDEEGEVRFM